MLTMDAVKELVPPVLQWSKKSRVYVALVFELRMDNLFEGCQMELLSSLTACGMKQHFSLVVLALIALNLLPDGMAVSTLWDEWVGFLPDIVGLTWLHCCSHHPLQSLSSSHIREWSSCSGCCFWLMAGKSLTTSTTNAIQQTTNSVKNARSKLSFKVKSPNADKPARFNRKRRKESVIHKAISWGLKKQSFKYKG